MLTLHKGKNQGNVTAGFNVTHSKKPMKKFWGALDSSMTFVFGSFSV